MKRGAGVLSGDEDAVQGRSAPASANRDLLAVEHKPDDGVRMAPPTNPPSFLPLCPPCASGIHSKIITSIIPLLNILVHVELRVTFEVAIGSSAACIPSSFNHSLLH